MSPSMQICSSSEVESVVSSNEPELSDNGDSYLKYQCSIAGCQATFKRLDQLDRHEYTHTQVKKHLCPYDGCEKTYICRSHLKRHYRRTHEHKKPPTCCVPCDIDGCDKMFQTTNNMMRHIRTVHENPKEYHCGHCNKKFTQRLKMRRHEISEHTKEYPFSCLKCHKGLYQKWQYEKHVNQCKVYQCGGCPMQFNKWSVYVKHRKEKQHGAQNYSCDHCDNVYSRINALKKHIIASHRPELRLEYKCDHEGCSRSYWHEKNLKTHQLVVHKGLRFRCDVIDCGREFMAKKTLNRHLVREHSDVKATDEHSRITKSGDSTQSTKRAKRKDAGQSVVSTLTKLSGLAMHRDLDKLVRMRDKSALDEVGNVLEAVQLPENEVDESIA